MRVIVFGGHGRVALLLAELLAARGDTVTSVIRNPDHLDGVAATGATPVVVDLESVTDADLRTLIAGNDAVVWAAGAGGGNPARTYAVDRDAAIASIDAAAAVDVRRYVMVSWIGSAPDHRIPADDAFVPYADAKLAADEHLRRSPLAWTILGPGTLTLDPPTGRIQRDPDGDGTVPRADVAAVAVAALDTPATVGRFLRFGTGDTPIAEAVTR